MVMAYHHVGRVCHLSDLKKSYAWNKIKKNMSIVTKKILSWTVIITRLVVNSEWTCFASWTEIIYQSLKIIKIKWDVKVSLIFK